MPFASIRPADPKSSSTKPSHVPKPGPGEVHIRHVAVGLNYADTYFRTGYYPAPLPNGIGVEASGTILAVGPGVDGFAPGDRVTYTGSPLGAYSTERVMPAGSLIKLPETIAFETAAAMTMRGLTAAYLLRRICPTLKAGDTILVHAAAGGVGLILTQWAKMLGLTVIGTVSSEAKAALARAHGCDHIIYYGTRERAGARARAHRRRRRRGRLRHASARTRSRARSIRCVAAACSCASGRPRDRFRRSTRCSSRSRARCTSRGRRWPTTSRIPKSARRSRASCSTTSASGASVEVMQHYALKDAVQAHRDLEARKTTGSSIFVI